jgi:transposase
VTFSLDITTGKIIRVLRQAPETFGGVPEELVIDNPKQMIISHSRQGTIRYQDDFLAFLGFYAIKPDPCLPYRARTKGKVENP